MRQRNCNQNLFASAEDSSQAMGRTGPATAKGPRNDLGTTPG